MQNTIFNVYNKLIGSLKFHALQMRREGVSAVWRKVMHSMLLIPASVIVLLARIVSPLVLIRFGNIRSTRIGHLSANTELYLCTRDRDKHKKRSIDIFCHSEPICNLQLAKMFTRKLYVTPFVYSLYKANKLFPGWERHEINLSEDRDKESLHLKFPAHISFTKEEERHGESCLRNMGVPKDAPFICFHARDSAYLNSIIPYDDWTCHDYRSMKSANSYLFGAEELTKRGYHAIRMGAVVEKPISTDNPKIIDYATLCRSDFMDIYLCAKCSFFVASCAGISTVPQIFRRPVVYVNFICLEHAFSWYPVYLFIPKKLQKRDSGRMLTFREIIDSGAGRFLETKEYERENLAVIENSPEEIKDVMVEMDERLKGTWTSSEEDEELQRKFWHLFKDSKLHGKIFARIGAKFLRQNRDLLN